MGKMKYYLGIDLGSTTSKAIIIDENNVIIGRGITNTRANYEVAAEIARIEAECDARFSLLRHTVRNENTVSAEVQKFVDKVEAAFRYLQFSKRFEILTDAMMTRARNYRDVELKRNVLTELKGMLPKIETNIKSEFFSGKVSATSQFFRDIFSAHFLREIESLDRSLFDLFLDLHDSSILPVENQIVPFDFSDLVQNSLELAQRGENGALSDFKRHIKPVVDVDLTPADYVGTGYGRQLLPFDKNHIKSEILCHAFGAHAYFSGTRTVLDIGGQDTKAIQVDEHGLVTSFQMNDRCAAGCGRYLGYIADELNLSVSDIGPLALNCDYETNICSTCTVFAGAELRDHLNLGEKRENILAGLHKAIVLRAFSLLARSGGVRNEFTFTGGVARNPAVVKYVSQMVRDNYGELTINIHPDSIFMGAVGAALLSKQRRNGE